MGWKNFKNHFGIEHIVHVRKNQILIGSNFVLDLASIDTVTGEVRSSDTSPEFLKKYYPKLLEASAEVIIDLIKSTDVFERDISVYTYSHERGEIIEKKCESPEWPNVTHDGCLMSDSFSTNKQKIIDLAKRNYRSDITFYLSSIKQTEDILSKQKQLFEQSKAGLAKLEADYGI